MAFTAADVKKLREMTSVGMMDCKKALTEADGDFDKAIELLREKAAESLELEKFEFYLSPLKLFPESVVYRGICLVQLLGKAHTERGASVFERVILRLRKVEKSIIRIKKKVFIFAHSDYFTNLWKVFLPFLTITPSPAKSLSSTAWSTDVTLLSPTNTPPC